MRFEQTRDVLEHARTFYQRVSELYEKLEGHADQQRVKMLLDYLGDKASELSAALEEFAGETPEGVLDTWFQYAHNDETFVCPDVDLGRDMSVEDVMKVAAQMHDCAVKVFTELAKCADNDEVRKVFENLSRKTQKEWEKLSRNVGMLLDM
jgi:hypothetical protein